METRRSGHRPPQDQTQRLTGIRATARGLSARNTRHLDSAQSLRLNRFLASCGLGSRRGCEELVRQGRVAISGVTAEDLSQRVTTGDKVTVDRKIVRPQEAITLILNKPAGYLSSTRSQGGKPTIFSLLPTLPSRIFHVGRLDAESEGLLLLTSDGDLAQKLSHPGHGVAKFYLATLDRPFDFARAPRLLRGMHIEGKEARFEAIWPAGRRTVRVELHQGLKRQIRVMFLYVGYEVKRLVRTQLGPLHLGPLKPGEWRFLSNAETRALRNPAPSAPRRRPPPRRAPRGSKM